jgi:hypothetical protein
VGATVFSKLSMEGAGHEEPEDGGRAATGILVSEPRARDIRWVAAAAVMSNTLISMLWQCLKPSQLCCGNVYNPHIYAVAMSTTLTSIWNVLNLTSTLLKCPAFMVCEGF